MKKLAIGIFFFVCICTLQVTAVIAESLPAPKGNLRYTVTVTKFANEAGWAGRWNIGEGFTTIMTNILHKSGWFIVLGDSAMRKEAMGEQDFAASGRTAKGSKAPKIGRMTPAQLLVRGSITHVQDTTSAGGGGINFKGFSIGGSAGEAEVNITIYLVDSETGQVKASTDIVGKSGRKGFDIGYFGSGLGGLTGSLGGQMNDNVGKACEDAVGQATMFLIDQLEGIPWEASVVLNKSGQVIINRGNREGVAPGMEFRVGEVEELVDPDTGEVLDSEMTEVAVIEVTKTKEKISYCAVKSSSGTIKKGMKVFPL